jgi:hypothetical protein
MPRFALLRAAFAFVARSHSCHNSDFFHIYGERQPDRLTFDLQQENAMILREIVHTCSNAHVARAALTSIGGDFAIQFAADASRRNISVGALAARMVKEFSTSAADEEWEGVDEAVRGADQPILSGLQYILSHGFGARTNSASGRNVECSGPWMRGAAPAQYWCA